MTDLTTRVSMSLPPGLLEAFDRVSHQSGSTASASLTVNKAPSVIVLSSSSFNAPVGDTITISGYLYPANTARIRIIYTGPSGTTINHTVNSTTTGSFMDQYAVNSAGTWTISASWTGTTTTASST